MTQSSYTRYFSIQIHHTWIGLTTFTFPFAVSNFFHHLQSILRLLRVESLKLLTNLSPIVNFHFLSCYWWLFFFFETECLLWTSSVILPSLIRLSNFPSSLCYGNRLETFPSFSSWGLRPHQSERLMSSTVWSLCEESSKCSAFTQTDTPETEDTLFHTVCTSLQDVCCTEFSLNTRKATTLTTSL